MAGGRDVVVTGMGVVSPAGVGVDPFPEAQLAARSGIRAISRFELADDDPVGIAGEVDLPPELTMDRRDALRSDRCTQLVTAAADLAVQHAGLDPAGVDLTRAGVVIGSGAGGVGTFEAGCRLLYDVGAKAVRARTIPMVMVNSPAASLAIRFGLTGPCTAVATACASGTDAIIAAAQAIRAGDADLVLAGGAEAPVTRYALAGFAALGALAAADGDPERASRPFAADRTGFVIAEGAAVLVLESASHAAARGARVHARLAGYGRSSDAFHATMPHPSGAGAAAAMRAALHTAGARPSDVGLVNSHGTGTLLNDAAEATALREVFGEAVGDLPVAATKSITGHSLGAAGAVEAVATIQALTSGLVPPTANLETPDAELGLDVVRGAPRRVEAGLALSNSFAFGGHNAVLAFARAA
jgi:3-oxoacyl-[acyl-carrier-protein] synthase II